MNIQPHISACDFKILPGQYYDSETNLHYNYFRDYDPSIGRYIQSDPIGLDGGLNTYLYVDANPINIFDTNGLLGRRSTDRINNIDGPFGALCGSGPTGTYIPDSPFVLFDFTEACKWHDWCYGCGSKAANINKGGCDRGFLKRMGEKCRRLIIPGWILSCMSTAIRYYEAVAIFGRKPFSNARDNCCG